MKIKLYLLCLVIGVFSLNTHAQSYIINTFAGDGVGGYSGNGGAATSAEIWYPYGVGLDPLGNTYIADFWNNRIRKIDTSGIISTIAGNGFNAGTGQGGYSGDGGLATNAELWGPSGIAVDDSGNIFIADYWNSVIRKINTHGIISTFAGNGNIGYTGDGGNADTTELWYPFGVGVDKSGNVYIADNGNNRIRMVNAKGIISTIAGNGYKDSNGFGGCSGDGGAATLAELDFPYGVAVDISGNIFIAENVNNRIRMVNNDGIISTMAGIGCNDTIVGSGGFSGDGGAATSAELNNPGGVAVDIAGNVYIADSWNDRIRKINADGIISTIAGDGYDSKNLGGGYSGDGGVATSAELYDPIGVAVDAIGDVYIADNANMRIRKLTFPTGINNIAAANPNSITLYPNPNNGNFTIQLQNLKQTTQVEIFNVLGEKIYTATLNSNNTPINLRHQPAGIYLYRVLDGHGDLVGEGKFVVE